MYLAASFFTCMFISDWQVIWPPRSLLYPFMFILIDRCIWPPRSLLVCLFWLTVVSLRRTCYPEHPITRRHAPTFCQSSGIFASNMLSMHLPSARAVVSLRQTCYPEHPLSAPTFCQSSGIFASNMLSRASLKFSDIMIVPSMASLRSFRVTLTAEITLCILSISCLRKMFIGCRAPIFWSRARTWNNINNDLNMEIIIAERPSSEVELAPGTT